MTQPVVSAATPAILPAGSEYEVKPMDPELFGREMKYRIAIALAKEMRRDGLISAEDFTAIDTILLDTFRPVLSGIYPRNRLIQ